jgi:hypothetical protein
LFLAPHHDDLLLSMPARIWHAAAEGSIHVAVIFSIEDDVLQATCRRLHRQFGVTVHELGLAEARQRGLSARQCFNGRRDFRDLPEQQVAPVAAAVLRTAENLAAREIVSPVTCVHIDHALTRAAAVAVAATQGVGLAFYADQPYASLWPRSVQMSGRREPAGGVAPRGPVRDILDALEGFVTKTDIRRILAGYGEQGPCSVEPLWQVAHQVAMQPCPASDERHVDG